MSESFLVGSILAITGGFLDAYTYLTRGKVLANAQTGNIVLLGINAAEGKWSAIIWYFIPILAFSVGIVFTELIRGCYKDKNVSSIHWRQIIVLLECLVVSIVAFLPTGIMDMTANVAVAFVCSVQVQSFRKVTGNAYATTMCTGNLRSAVELCYRKVRYHDCDAGQRGLQYFGIIGFFAFGTILGAWFTSIWAERSALFCSILLLFVFSIMFVKEKE